jgi:hypothetical protein
MHIHAVVHLRCLCTHPDPEIGVRELIVDAKTSAKIDAYLSEVINVLDIQISRTPKGIRYKIEPFEHCPSVSGISTVMYIVEKFNIIVDVALLLLSLSLMLVDYWEQGHQ